MRKILLSFVLTLAIFLVSCTDNDTTTIHTFETYEEDIIIEFSFDMIDSIAETYDPIVNTYYIDDTYQVTQIKVLTSEFLTTPFEWEYYSNVHAIADEMRELFNDIRTDEIYENQYLERQVGFPGQLLITLTNTQDEAKVITLELFYFSDTETSSLRLSYYQNDTLYFYYEFDNFTEEISQLHQFIMISLYTY